MHAIVDGEGPYTVAIGMGSPGEVVWSTKVPIPAVSATIEESWTAGRSLEVGEPVYFHIHNHGENNWSLTGLTATF